MKNKIKILLSFVLLAVVVFAAVPKVYIHSFLGHSHQEQHISSDEITVTKTEGTQDCNFEKFDTPVYYTVFKFILNFLPLKESKKVSFFYHQKSIPKLQYTNAQLRAPPIA